MLIRTFALLAAGAALGLQAGCASQAPAASNANVRINMEVSSYR